MAAGEVIERPAAALKELMENSLDAGATSLTMTLAGGGADLLQVQDDGGGIVGEDLPAALMRHATSKIESEEDFSSVQTFGFRGEALASLAAVSEFSIASRQPSEPFGHVFSPGMAKPKPQPMAAGTVVSARGLFADFPARRRFLRSAATENAHCVQAAMVAAIAAPFAAFVLQTDKRMRLQLPAAADETERLTALFPKLKDNLIPLSESAGALSLHGAIFAPRLGASGKNIGQYMYVNRRFVRDRILRRAMADALRGMSHDGEPGYALFLELPPAMADVNTHPAKLELRFMEPRAVFEFVRRAAGKALAAPLGAPLAADNLPTPLRRKNRARAFPRRLLLLRNKKMNRRLREPPAPLPRNILQATPPPDKAGWNRGGKCLATFRNGKAAAKTAAKRVRFPILRRCLATGRWGGRWRSCTTFTFSPKTAPGWWWWICTPPTSAFFTRN